MGFVPVQDTLYGYFISQNGLRLYFNAGSDGNSISEQWVLEDPSTGESRMIAYDALPIVRDGEGQMHRIIYPLQGTESNLFKLFFGYVDGWTQVYPEPDVGVIRIFSAENTQ